MTEKKRNLGDTRHGVASRKYVLYEPSYLDLKRNTPKPGKREREERRNQKMLGIYSSATKLHYDSQDHVAYGSNR